MNDGVRLRGVYLLTPDWDDTARLLAVTEAALAAGVLALQFRHKQATRALAVAQAGALRALTRAHGALLIVNDDPQLARDVGADGVHVGRDDATVAQARELLGSGACVGASCYDRFDAAGPALAAGADYVAFGSMFASRTKPAAVRASLSLLARARGLVRPGGGRAGVVAIGGIDADNIAGVAAAGADAAALISAIYDAPDPHAAARRLVERFAAGQAQAGSPPAQDSRQEPDGHAIAQ
jgi:thiamine-phosphate pyrophosphorylase